METAREKRVMVVEADKPVNGLRRASSAAAVALMVLAAHPERALACACCSNEGQRYVETDKLDAFATGLLDELRFTSAAHLYTGEATSRTSRASPPNRATSS